MNLPDFSSLETVIITASAALLAASVCLVVLCVPKVRVKVKTEVEVEIK